MMSAAPCDERALPSQGRCWSLFCEALCVFFMLFFDGGVLVSILADSSRGEDV